MIIAGAGGHALEVIDLLIALGKKDFTLYGEKFPSNFIRQTYPVFSNLDELPIHIQSDPFFCLGIGNPVHRHKLYSLFTSSGAALFPLRGASSRISSFAELPKADVMELCYIGSQTRIGQGSLINTGAQIHHEVQIGEFTVINPTAVLLGACQIGDFCSIGSNATILPGIKVGSRVNIGAGAVIIRDVPDGQTVVGVPGLPVADSSR
ncbi:acetyltransferase [Algoriphagus sp.]|uniref:acetyltransferase n=1 Tax=Algoriphagus sp. TaxID=1872435 RepID=UPI00272FE0CF|nr:acetyltransferase [Algoriphagus sp.]MDP2039836.1 acetyltransferase [Algoriphagus sp.]